MIGWITNLTPNFWRQILSNNIGQTANQLQKMIRKPTISISIVSDLI